MVYIWLRHSGKQEELRDRANRRILSSSSCFPRSLHFFEFSIETDGLAHAIDTTYNFQSIRLHADKSMICSLFVKAHPLKIEDNTFAH
jgi:hypothetical protein